MHPYRTKGFLSPKDTLNRFERELVKILIIPRTQRTQRTPIDQSPSSIDSIGVEFPAPAISDWNGERGQHYSL